MREIWFSLLIVLSLAGASPAIGQTPPKPAPGGGEALAVKPDDRVLGKAEAPITIIEYASLTCPHCAHFEVDVLPKLKEKWIDSGKAKLEMRAFPRDEADLRAAKRLLSRRFKERSGSTWWPGSSTTGIGPGTTTW